MQKPAEFYNSKVGILDPEQFAKHVHMERYEPTTALEPFVAHYFIARYTLPDNTSFVATNILSQPVVHIMFTHETSFIEGPLPGKRQLSLKGAGVFAGIRFKPGGFYPFGPNKIDILAQKIVLTQEVFSEVDKTFSKDLLKQNDAGILELLELLLKNKHPRSSPKIEQVDAIVSAIESDLSLSTTFDIAKRFHISERALQNLFRTYLGVGVKWVIMRIRLLKAVGRGHKAQKTNWTTVAADLGYSTQSHFVNDFKKVVGLSPSKYLQTITRP